MREWVECMAANGYIDYDPITKGFSISKEHARVLCDRDSISYTIPFVYWAPTLSLVMDNFSVLICLPQSMEHPNSKATGAAMTPSTFEKYAKEAGFSKIEILPIEHLIWQFYRLTK